MPRGRYVPLQYKPGFLRYQARYFKDVYEEYIDCSIVIYRGGRPVGIWPICMYIKDGKFYFGTAGMALMGPLFSDLPKAEGQRDVINSCLRSILDIVEEEEGETLLCSETILDEGASQWIKKLMECGGRTSKMTWQVFADLSLSMDEIQSRMRRTNKYSAAKGRNEYNIEIYDSKDADLDNVFEEFHTMHREVSGKETRNQDTWDIQKSIICENDESNGYSFVIFIRDKKDNKLAGSALFDSTPQTGLYCVAVYDRSKFSKPVGHIVQAVAMEKMKEQGIRWYEIGERAYPSDIDTNEKLINIGHYKEGFATHMYPRIFVEVSLHDKINF